LCSNWGCYVAQTNAPNIYILFADKKSTVSRGFGKPITVAQRLVRVQEEGMAQVDAAEL
jgi:hypothetical protein